LKKYTVEKNIDDIKKEIEALLISIFGRTKYEKQGKDLYCFYPAYNYAELEDYYKCVTVMVRKLTNTKTVVIVNYNNDGITSIDWKHRPLQMVYDKTVDCIPQALHILDV
jgi:ABC-type Zn uptake system ZnuABC Zn-binding protein ZnuA